jgi:hypothetical protein
VLGIINIIISLLIYLADVSLFASLWFLLILILVTIGFTIYATIDYRKESGGYLGFKDAFLHGAIVMFVAMIIGRLFSILLFNVIDPTLGQTITDITIETWTKRMEGWGTPQDAIDKAVADMSKDMPEQFSPIGLLKSIVWPGLLITAIAASISAAIAKRKRPETF